MQDYIRLRSKRSQSLTQALTAGACGSPFNAALVLYGSQLHARARELFANAPALMEGLFLKLGQIVGLDASRIKVTGQQPKIAGKTEIRVLSIPVGTTPKADSITLQQARQWFREQVPHLVKGISKDLSPAEQVKVLWQIRQEEVVRCL